MMKLFTTTLFLLFFSFTSISQTTPDILGLIEFANKLEGQMSLRKQKLKLITQRSGQNLYTGKLKGIEDEILGIECSFKNKFIPSAIESLIFIDYSKKKTFHRIIELKYSDSGALKKDYLDSKKILTLKYKYYGVINDMSFNETKSDTSIIMSDFKDTKNEVGYKVSNGGANWEKYYIEIYIDTKDNLLIVKLFDYRGLKF